VTGCLSDPSQSSSDIPTTDGEPIKTDTERAGAMTHYCTMFDHRYLPQGLALHHSMLQHIKNFRLWILALSPECERVLERIRPQGVRIVSLRQLEDADPDFHRTRQTRSLAEYYFTSTPCFIRHLLERFPEINRLTYLDADTFFFSDPDAVERDMETSSIAITPHRFRPELESHRKYGTFNKGVCSFQADSTAKECLAEWRKQCLEWCRDEPEKGRFADQGYLDAWPEKYPGTQVLDQPGFNEAPWNVDVDKITKKNGKIFIGNHPLVLFHFQSLRRISTQIFNPNWHDYGLGASRNLIRWIYQPYLSTLLSVECVAGISPGRQDLIRRQIQPSDRGAL